MTRLHKDEFNKMKNALIILNVMGFLIHTAVEFKC